MSRQQSDDQNARSRPRANTSFTFPSWRRGKTEPVTPAPVATPTPVLSLEELIKVLTPPAVPSLSHARSLASVLVGQTPLPPPAVINPVLAALCSDDSPPALQIAGYDVITAYWENGEATSLGTADRLSYFSLFLGSATAWSSEIWKPRFKALRALSSEGTELVGMEVPLLNVLQAWIRGAFDGLLRLDSVDPAERAEREHSLEALTASMSLLAENVDIVARLPDAALAEILQFYTSMVDSALDLPPDLTTRFGISPVSPADTTSSVVNSPTRPHSHRRHPSSLSVPQHIPSPITIPQKHPVDIAVTMYTNHLTSQMKNLDPSQIIVILPILFRALAFYASPLPRLSISLESEESSPFETQLEEMLHNLLVGPFSTSCHIILKEHLFPPADHEENIKAYVQTSIGAHRTYRCYIRRRLYSRIARAFINRESAGSYSQAGAPSHMDLARDLMERAWPKEEAPSWDSERLGRSVHRSVEEWVNWVNYHPLSGEDFNTAREKILEEVAGIVKDVFQELDMREDDGGMTDDSANSIGLTLYHLARYIHIIRTSDGSRFIIPLSQPTDAPTPFLRTLTSLLARDHSTYMNPLLSTTLLSVADHLSDADASKLPAVMFEQHDLSPTSPEWLINWENLLSNPDLLSQNRPLTRAGIVNALQAVYESVQDMPAYRIPLATLIFKFCQRQVDEDKDNSEGDVVWRLLGEEVISRTVEGISRDDIDSSEVKAMIEEHMALLSAVALGGDYDDDDDTASVHTAGTHSPSIHTSFSTAAQNSPTMSRMQSDYPQGTRDRDSNMPSVMALLSSLTTSASSRSQSQQPQDTEEQSADLPTTPPIEGSTTPRSVGAVIALVTIFSQLAFTPSAHKTEALDLAARVYDLLLNLMTDAKSPRARLTTLQFMMRIRADRDHRIYFVDAGYDPDGRIRSLAASINRAPVSKDSGRGFSDEPTGDSDFVRRARARLPQERDGRKASRGRGGRVSGSASSRSRSRVPTQNISRAISGATLKPRERLWRIPEQLPFHISDAETPSQGLLSYDSVREEHDHVLQLSNYLSALVTIIEKESNWEILSYVLCHLPVQLANKHLFCGPRCRSEVTKLLKVLCAGLIEEKRLAAQVDRWPTGLKARDAHGLAYHTVSVLISYRRCFDVRQQSLLVEVLQDGLDGQATSIKCCLHGLSLASLELQSSMKKCLTRVLEKLSQIMSNPEMAVHILSFLTIVGSLRELHSNFTSDDYKMVFGVALQYLQHYNRPGSSPTTSWALSQHLRILAYYIIYIWFLAVKLSDRPQHIPFITRQLLLANEGKEAVDEPTEVCFDWLARYTYASADPRPTDSLLSEIVMNPTTSGPSELAVTEKSWLVGNSVITIRALARLGWVEILTRRPSGYTKFLCRVENVPMVGLGDVDPDLVSTPASLIMDHRPTTVETPSSADIADGEPDASSETVGKGHLSPENIQDLFSTNESTGDRPPNPDPIKGYVWSGSAPSQRRKHVAIDPAFFALHLSSYPKAGLSPENRRIINSSLLPPLFRTLDRMPVIDTHTVGIMYVAPGQTDELDILRNIHGSPAYTRFLEGLGRLINLRGQKDVYAGGLDPDQDGEYAYAWWDDIGQFLFHTATMMPTTESDPQCNNKKAHIGNDYVRIIWNDSGSQYKFDTLKTQFQFVNIVVEPHSLGAIAAFSNNLHENEYFKVTVQRAPGMIDFTPIGEFKLISEERLPHLVRQLSLLADWFSSVFRSTSYDTKEEEITTNWRSRLQAIQRFRDKLPKPEVHEPAEGIFAQEAHKDFTISY